MPRICLLGVAVLALLVPSGAEAATIPVVSDYQGWINSDGSPNGGLNGNNTFTGNYFGTRYNSWAAFNLSGVSGTVTSATLEIGLLRYPSNDPTPNTVDIHDVSTPLSTLLSFNLDVAGYTDLGTGNLYGSVTGANGNYFAPLTAQAVADINAALGGSFQVGFTNATQNAQDPHNGDATGGIGIYTNDIFGVNGPILLLTTSAVPEPSSLVLLSLGFCAFGAFIRTRRRLA
jgi:hypothetical protein